MFEERSEYRPACMINFDLVGQGPSVTTTWKSLWTVAAIVSDLCILRDHVGEGFFQHGKLESYAALRSMKLTLKTGDTSIEVLISTVFDVDSALKRNVSTVK